MKSISKGNQVHLFNAYSKIGSTDVFISGSDRVGIELIKNSSDNIFVLAPYNFKDLLPRNCTFISTQDTVYSNLFFNYLYRTIKTILLLRNLSFNKASIITTSDFFCDTIPAFIFSKKFKWFAFSFHLYPSFFKDRTLRNFLGNIAQFFSFYLFKSASKVLTTNNEVKDFLLRTFKLNKVKKINLGLDCNSYFNSNSSRTIDLLYLGRIKESKGVFELPEIISSILKVIPNLKVEVVGNGSSEDLTHLKELISKYKVEDVIRINTNLKDEQVTKFLSNSKFLIQLSREEGFGLVILEALASGCSVIGYKLPVYIENFFEFELDLVGDFDQESLIILIIEKLKNYRYKDLNRKNFINFNWKSIYNSIFNS